MEDHYKRIIKNCTSVQQLRNIQKSFIIDNEAGKLGYSYYSSIYSFIDRHDIEVEFENDKSVATDALIHFYKTSNKINVVHGSLKKGFCEDDDLFYEICAFVETNNKINCILSLDDDQLKEFNSGNIANRCINYLMNNDHRENVVVKTVSHQFLDDKNLADHPINGYTYTNRGHYRLSLVNGPNNENGIVSFTQHDKARILKDNFDKKYSAPKTKKYSPSLDLF